MDFELECNELSLMVIIYVLSFRNVCKHGNCVFHKLSCTVISTGKPAKCTGPLDVSNVHDTGCTLKWEEPKDDGGLPIKEYEIEKMDLATGKWIRCGKVSCDLISLLL